MATGGVAATAIILLWAYRSTDQQTKDLDTVPTLHTLHFPILQLSTFSCFVRVFVKAAKKVNK